MTQAPFITERADCPTSVGLCFLLHFEMSLELRGSPTAWGRGLGELLHLTSQSGRQGTLWERPRVAVGGAIPLLPSSSLLGRGRALLVVPVVSTMLLTVSNPSTVVSGQSPGQTTEMAITASRLGPWSSASDKHTDVLPRMEFASAISL